MTKSIEEQAQEYAGKRYNKYLGTHISESWSITKANYLAGAKARDDQWLEVVNELRASLSVSKTALRKVNNHGLGHYEDCEYLEYEEDENLCDCAIKEVDHWLQTALQGSTDSLTKADKLLREMNIK